MFWCSAFVHNELHALAHSQPLFWTAFPQAGSAAGTEELFEAGMCLETVQVTDQSVFLMAQLLLPYQTLQDSQGSPDPIRKRMNCASWFPIMSLLPVVLITRGLCQDNLQGFLSVIPHYAVSVCTCRGHSTGATDAFNLMCMSLNILSCIRGNGKRGIMY